MKTICLLAFVSSLVWPVASALAETPGLGGQVGDTYEITVDRESSQQRTDNSTSSSHDKDAIVERVVAETADGVELEYDLPSDSSAEDRASNWQFPVRVLKAPGGAIQLLNQDELKARVDKWLKAGNMTRAACGHWIFTWNAFRIECEPESVITTLRAFEVGPAPHEGGLYALDDALGPAPLVRNRLDSDGATFTAELKADPDAVRRSRAEGDVVVGEIMRKPVTLEATLQVRAREEISGTISVTLETDSAGNVWRRTKVTKLQIEDKDGNTETDTITESVERRLVSKGGRS